MSVLMAGAELANIDDLHPHPGNPRRSDLAPLVKSLETTGQYRPVVVNRGTKTGRPNEILSGHHIVRAAGVLGWQQIAVVFVDVDNDTGTTILLADNRLADNGGYDDEAVLTLLRALPSLEGTGYSPEDIDDLAILLESQSQIIFEDGPELDRRDEKNGKFDFESPWKHGDRRIMVLDLPVPLFVWLQERLTELSESRGLAANVDVILELVAQATGQDVPTEPEDEPAAAAQ